MALDPFQFEPARDLGLTHRQRVLSLRRETGLAGAAVHTLWWGGVRAYMKLYHRLTVDGEAPLPAEPPFVLVANHTSHLDVMALASQCRARHRNRIFPLAAGDTFFQTPVRATFAAGCLNALPMWRDNAGRHALDELRQRLVAERCIYIVFPEGTRSRDGVTAPFRAGLGMLVAGSPVPVVPCCINGAWEAMAPHHRLPRPHRVTLRVGHAMTFSDLPNRKKGWQQVAQRCNDAVNALRTGATGQPPAPAPGPAPGAAEPSDMPV